MAPIPASEKLARPQKVTIVVTIGLCVLTVILNILVREWYSPDLRYHVGDFYYLDDRVATSCEVKNLGHETTKVVRVYAKFDSAILGYQIGGNISSHATSGGVGEKYIIIEIDRLVPRGSFTVFFSVKQAPAGAFIEKIEGDEGLAKIGEPELWTILPAAVVCFVALVSFIFYWFKWERQSERYLFGTFESMLEFALGSAKAGASKAEILRDIEIAPHPDQFHKEVMMRIASAIYDHVGHGGGES